ncbi:MAG: hypothetical protein PUD91_01840 [Bacteroidales bacterium]|nr:hypothetical protein [Bacteroidales bacterium]
MIRLIFLLLVAAAVMSCGGGSKASAPTRAAEARTRATEAALRLIATSHTDTMAMQHSILDAKAIQSEYIMAGDTAAVRAFDEAFRSKLRTDDPELASAVL